MQFCVRVNDDASLYQIWAEDGRAFAQHTMTGGGSEHSNHVSVASCRVETRYSGVALSEWN